MAIERIEPGTIEWEAFYANHINRYQFATNIIGERGGSILDSACGVGYGSFFLATNTQCNVVGLDISAEALEVAKSKYQHSSVACIRDDVTSLSSLLPFPPFDFVVSFETLEHLKDQNNFLRTLVKVLATEGKIVISSPNALVSSPEGVVKWDYREKTYTD